MPWYSREIETIEGKCYAIKESKSRWLNLLTKLTFHADDDVREIIVDHGNQIRRYKLLKGKGSEDYTYIYWFPEDIVKHFAMLEKFDTVNKRDMRVTPVTQDFFRTLFGLNDTFPVNKEIIDDALNNKERYKDHPMESKLCLAVAMASHPRLGAQSPLNCLINHGIIANIVPGYHFDLKYKWK
jgi:hypothetical protein